jgi:adenosylcobinamide kinase / adenosylcobinamide-phosphate guanylyltransferase
VSPEAETRKKSVTLVLGGAQSGKSYYAQQLASHFERVAFIATARGTDAEMRRKIARHRCERPAAWKTIEAPLDLENAVRAVSRESDVVLVDCLTVYVDNVMSAGRKSRSKSDWIECINAVCDSIRTAEASVIVVSNEVGSGVVPPYRSGRAYRNFLGQMNQKVAQIADRVILMVAGVPMTVKESGASQEQDDGNGVRPAAHEVTPVTNGSGKRHSRSREIFK